MPHGGAYPIVDNPNGPKVQKVRLREMAEAPLREQRHNRPAMFL